MYKKLIDSKKKLGIKYTEVYPLLGITKQNFFYHLQNLKEGKVTFSVKQLKIICEKFELDPVIFFE